MIESSDLQKTLKLLHTLEITEIKEKEKQTYTSENWGWFHWVLMNM